MYRFNGNLEDNKLLNVNLKGKYIHLKPNDMFDRHVRLKNFSKIFRTVNTKSIFNTLYVYCNALQYLSFKNSYKIMLI